MNTGDDKVSEQGVDYLYRGENQKLVPDDITRVVVDSSVKEIPRYTFKRKQHLEQVVLREGVQEIGRLAFEQCKLLNRITFPSTLKVIGTASLAVTGLVHVELPVGLEQVEYCAFLNCPALRTVVFRSTVAEIGGSAFATCDNLVSVKLPVNLRVIEYGMFSRCRSLMTQRIPTNVTRFETRENSLGAFYECFLLLSVELPIGLTTLGQSGHFPTFGRCRSLVNVALPSSLGDVDAKMFEGCVKLKEMFPVHGDLVNALKRRFDDLPLHELCYYHSYYSPLELQTRLGKVFECDTRSGEKVDAFGMTPFHILALSAEPNLDLFQKLVEEYTAHVLDEKDKWGRSVWEYLGLNNAPRCLELIRCFILRRLNCLGLERWRAPVQTEFNILCRTDTSATRRRQLSKVLYTLTKYECFEGTSLLELALWKMKIEELFLRDTSSGIMIDQSKQQSDRLGKATSTREPVLLDHGVRMSCRINCGSEIIIPRLLSFLR